MPKLRKTTNQLKKKLLKKTTKEPRRIPSDQLLSSGCTILNLACTGNPRGAFKKGHYYLFVGGTSSGKTFLCWTCLAEACLNPIFDDYRLIFDNAEDGSLMDIEYFFGKQCRDRVEPPALDKDGDPLYSEFLEDFYYNIDDALEEDKPFIYILDSVDALGTEVEEEHFQKSKKAARKGKKASGTFGTSRPKVNSTYIRRLMSRLTASGSIVIVINQSRTNIGFGSQFNPETRAGGRALEFYATLVMWSSVRKRITRTYKGKKRKLGIKSIVKIKKNRAQGKEREVIVPMYYNTGVDDTGACVEYLIDEGHWKGSENGERVSAPEFDFKGTKEDLIRQIEEENGGRELRKLTTRVWNEIERACAVQRKRRYR